MILAVYGTTGELIKLAPVLRRLAALGQPSLLTATTAQQVTQIPQFLTDLGVPEPDWWLAHGYKARDLEQRSDIPRWLCEVTGGLVRRRGSIRAALARGAGRPLLLVHGDTMTTVIGAAAGRAFGMPVAHIEAGLRSGSWREPFPEELDRRIASKLATIHFVPGPWAASNLERAGVRGTIIDTGGNTVADAIREQSGDVPVGVVPDEPFGLVSLHREELLGDEALLRETIAAVAAASELLPLLFVDHSVTVGALRRTGLDAVLGGSRVRRIQRLPHGHFIALAQRAELLLTDSGGSQEECAALGIPCLVHRRRTERLDGLDSGIVRLSGLDAAAIVPWVRERQDARAAGHGHTSVPDVAPSDVVVDWLVAHDYGAR